MSKLALITFSSGSLPYMNVPYVVTLGVSGTPATNVTTSIIPTPTNIATSVNSVGAMFQGKKLSAITLSDGTLAFVIVGADDIAIANVALRIAGAADWNPVAPASVDIIESNWSLIPAYAMMRSTAFSLASFTALAARSL